ncbi:ANTAR domain-containing protein, partial [Salmonella enterica subsp. enterica serovar Saintpaul]|nr:ANTAR domain-containing protein [Salmonella enterica subsp. enterica serovar Saintpaul]
MSVQRSEDAVLLFEYDAQTCRWTWSEGLRELHGLSSHDEPTTDIMLERMLEEDRVSTFERFQEHLRTPGPYSCVYRMRDPAGRLHSLRYVGYSEPGGDEIKRLYGFVIDITSMLHDNATRAVAGALEHRAEIEQAKGALMLTFNIDDQAAFELLRSYSSRTNTKLAVVAQRITYGLHDPRHLGADPVRKLLD